ncbi:hypothetical protein niasHS_017969 [Heterodera schachtii]|uniref:GTP-binding protein Rhes n=1 Tax=Heterodera schachtii TaxID=97005 RepID=A0ABD2I572_HETSC
MLDSYPPYGADAAAAYRRRPSSANHCSPKMSEVVEAVMTEKVSTSQSAKNARRNSAQPRRCNSQRLLLSTDHRKSLCAVIGGAAIAQQLSAESDTDENGNDSEKDNQQRNATQMGEPNRHAVERSQSQLSQPSGTRALEHQLHEAAPHRRSRRSYDVNAQRRSPPMNGVAMGGPAGSTDPTAHPQTQLTLVLMGAPRVGKSALVNQFLWEGFLHDYRPTVEEFNWVEYGSDEPNSPQLLLQLIDSSGSRDFLAMRHLYYRIGDAFMVVYSVNDPNSFAEAQIMLREIEQLNSKKAPVLLVANKSDLVPVTHSTSNLSDSNGAVSAGGCEASTPKSVASATSIGQTEAEAEQHRLLNSVRRMRISAKNLDQVKGAFTWLIDALVRRSQITSLPLRDGRSSDSNLCSAAALRKALTRRRQSLPSRRTASELGIDEETLRRLVRRHDKRQRHAACVIQ